MANMPTVCVLLDGVEVTVTLALGDYVRAEQDGHTFTGEPSSVANACVTWHALNRSKRKGLISVDIPATFDDFLDAFDYADNQPDDDPKDSGQGPSTG